MIRLSVPEILQPCFFVTKNVTDGEKKRDGREKKRDGRKKKRDGRGKKNVTEELGILVSGFCSD